MNNKLKLKIGNRFGKWEIISEETYRENNQTQWLCRCDCGNEKYVPLNNLMNGSSSQCKNCAVKENAKKRSKGYKDISGTMWSKIKRKGGDSFDLRIEEAWDLFVKQKKRCIYSGLNLIIDPKEQSNTTAVLVLDKPLLGYKKDNVIWVHKDVAKMIGNMSMTKFNHMLTLIIDKAVNGYKKEVKKGD